MEIVVDCYNETEAWCGWWNHLDGRLVQYAGRLHRDHEAKAGVLIHDYLDAGHPLTEAMSRRRMSAYANMGYEIENDAGPPSQTDALPLRA